MKLGSIVKKLLLSRYTWIILPVIVYLLKRFTVKAVAEIENTIQPTDMEVVDDDDDEFV